MNDMCVLLLILIVLFLLCQYNNSTFEGFLNDFDTQTNNTTQQVQQTLQKQQQRKLRQQQQQQPQNVVHAYESIYDYSPLSNNSQEVPSSLVPSYKLIKNKGVMNDQQLYPDVNNLQMDSQLHGFDPSYKGGLLDSQMLHTTTDTGDIMGGVPNKGKQVEVHMVYGEWCGHSKNAKPAFKELVNKNDIKTKNGSPVQFKMTTDDSKDFKDMFSQGDNKVTGFPTYMTVVKQHENDENPIIKELKTLGRDADSIITAAVAIPH
jgi:thiol-disulfide isomerase/thioredoxin